MLNKVTSPQFSHNGRPLRYIRSFVRRQGRLTKRQQYALDHYWPIMGIRFEEQFLNYATLFGSNSPVTLEIGFGMGDSLVSMAKSYPEKNFIGIEVYSPGVGACLANAYDEGLKNLRIICHDAVEVLHKMIPINSLHTVQLFFPDPWQKTRHRKRRILQKQFGELIKNKLQIGGLFYIVTDWKPYAEYILEVMASLEGYKNHSSSNDYVCRPKFRPITKFERRSHRLGHAVLDLLFEKVQ